MKKVFCNWFAVCLSAVFCFSVPNALADWEPLFRGVAVQRIARSMPQALSASAIRVDLQEKSISLLVSPSNGAKPKEVDAKRTSTFLQEASCQIAINGSVFSPKALQEGQGVDVHGLAISSSSLYSKPTRFSALLIRKNNQVQIAAPPFSLAGVRQALSGYYRVLDAGKVVGADGKRHPRSLVGVSRSGRYLFLVAVDGRRPGVSDGLTLRGAGELLLSLGAWDGLNLDGGGSTTLVRQGSNGLPELLNRPSDGIERIVANHLCVFAKPLP